MSRRLLVLITVVAAAVAAVSVQPAGPPGSAAVEAFTAGQTPRPNIVVILTDDMSTRELGAMPRTRQLIGQRGVTFARSFAPFPLCCPSRVSMLTGQYAHNHGVLGNGATDGFHPEGGFAGFTTDGNTLATWLNRTGYQTVWIGKYLNGYGEPGSPARKPPGWDGWHGTVGGSYRTFEVFEQGELVEYRGTHRTTWTNRAAVDVIHSRIPQAAPLFLFVSHFAPHNGRPVDPDDPPTELGFGSPSPAPTDRNDFHGVELPRSPAFNEKDVRDKPATVRNKPLLTNAQVRALQEIHQQRLEALRAVDRGVAAVIGALRAAGELDNTVIVFTSDNGYMMGQHRIIKSKTTPYEPAIRVPLLMRGPGVPTGVVRQQLVGTVDLAPTVARLAGAVPGRVFDGTSLMPLARNPSAMAGRDLVVEMGPTRIGGPMEFTGLRTRRYTYVVRRSGERELYDLRRDPFQLSNLIGSPDLDPDLKAMLAKQHAEMHDCAGEECRAQTPY
jgi:arylsulfatase A-like enzyme